MAIGTTAAILGSAVIGGVGSAIASGNNKKAAQQATTAQTNAANQNNALQASIYNQNKGILAPYAQSGYGANQQINALLGIPTNSAGTAYIGDQGQYSGQGSGVPAAQGAAPAMTAQQGFQNYQNSTGYQFRLNQGQNALGANWLARGLGKSGAAAKSVMSFGQGIASDEFGNYLNALGHQQNVGLSAGSALAGVGQTYAGQVSNNNNQSASAIANGAIARANNNNALWGNLAGTAGYALGGLSSYR